MKLYSPSAVGFFDTEVHTTVPQDAIEITDETYTSLLAGQEQGMSIVTGIGGIPGVIEQQVDVFTAKATKQRQISNLADSFLASLASEYGAYEKLTWDQQAVESDALAANPDAPAPLVRSIAAARSMDTLELAARIRANRAQWVLLSGSIVGQRLAYQDALDAAETVEEIGAIVPVYAAG